MPDDNNRAYLDTLMFRLRAAVADAAIEHGVGSPEHLRLRYVLCGQGPGAPSDAAYMMVMSNEQGTADA